MTINDMQDMADKDERVEIDSILAFFQFDIRNEGKTVASHEYCKAGFEQHKLKSRDYQTVQIEIITCFHDNSA